MLIVYDTMTKNVQSFVDKLPKDKFKCCHINNYDGTSEFILVTYTINFGEMPKTTEEFLDEFGHNLIAVSSSGNKLWGAYYGKAADVIAKQYRVPIISKFELKGNKKDIYNFIEGVERIEEVARIKLASKNQG